MNLMPCPFCGSENTTIDYVQHPLANSQEACCWDCGATGPTKKSREEAQTAWNKRIERKRDANTISLIAGGWIHTEP